MFKESALQLSAAIKGKEIGVCEAVSAYIDLIEEKDRGLNAFITVAKENALKRAHEIQSRIDNGETLSPLAGVPIALKDNISTIGIETTCASKMHKDHQGLSGYMPVFNATVVDRLEKAGMIVIGKLNMDEFAMGGCTGIFGAARNPLDVSFAAGDGSAAAVAAGEAPLSLGSDTGGGIRRSCSLCGVTGIKPTYGAVSRHGLAACGSSLDQIGPVGKNIDDCAALLSIISGADNTDGTCVLEKPFEFDKAGVQRLDGVRIGLPSNYFEGDIDGDVKLAVLSTVKEFEAAGAVIKEFEMPLMDYIIPVWYIIVCAEASSNLARYDGLKFGFRSADAKSLSEVYRLSRSEGFGLEVKKRIMFGSFALSSGCYDIYFKKAMQVRTLIRDAYNNLFRQFDMILSPVMPAVSLNDDLNDPVKKIYTRNIFTASVNLAGLPAAALPCGFGKQGLPVGFQLIGKAFSEAELINAARVYQNRVKSRPL